MNNFNRKQNIKTNINPSILSSTPPWPGKILLIFLILIFLFRKDAKRSPSWHTKDINIVKNKKFNSKKFINNLFKKNTCREFINSNDEQLKMIDPIAPE